MGWLVHVLTLAGIVHVFYPGGYSSCAPPLQAIQQNKRKTKPKALGVPIEEILKIIPVMR